jgi:cell division transport system permease protein
VNAIVTRPTYFVRRALEAMVRRPRIALVATGTIFVAVLVTGAFAAALHAGERLLGAWAGETEISVYLDPAADLAAARDAAAALAPGRAVEAVTSGEALRRFRAALGPEGALLDGLGEKVLPPSIEIRAPGITLPQARALAARLQAVPGARDVDYGNAWIEKLERLVERLRWAGAALLAAIAVGAAVLVANTLQLGVFARRDEIDIMKLVGATDSFVQVPFLIEGLLQGVAGGALAAAALVAGCAAGLPRLAAGFGLAGALAPGELVTASTVLALVAAGAGLGLVASALAVARELRRS